MTIVKSDVIVASNGGIIGPVEDTDTWATHFTSRGWTTPDDQIAGGYPIYIQPAQVADGYYEEDWDYGSVIDTATILVGATTETISGSPTIQIDISYKQLIGDPWTTTTNTTELTATTFRYVKVRVNFLAAAGTDLALLRALDVRIQRAQRLIDFTKDLGAGRSSGTFDITGLSGLTANTAVLVMQSAAPIASKGDARDEAEMDTISATGYVVDATTVRCYWRATAIVVGTYAFYYMMGV